MINTTSDISCARKFARWYQLIGTSLLLLCSFSSWADSSCYLLSSETFTFPAYTTSVNVIGMAVNAQLGAEVVLGEKPPTLASDCKVAGGGGGTGLKLSSFAGDAVVATVDGIPVLRTNIKGIGYALGLRCISRTSDGCDVYKNQTVWLGQSVSWNTQSSWYPYDTTDTMYWRIVLRIYQLSDYQFLGDQLATNNDDNFKTGAWLQIGGVTQPTANINFGSVMINLHGTYPTCTTVMSQGGSIINLGDYSVSELSNNNSPRIVPFNITFSGCSNLTSITTKLTSNYLISGTTLMGDKNRYRGVGVEISSGEGNVLVPNNANSKYVYENSFKADSRTMTLYATLKNNGQSTITPGAFETGGTLTFTYQ